MEELIDVFNAFPYWVRLGIGVMAVLLVVQFVLRFFRREAEPDYIIAVRCLSCGWQGKVSRYRPVCRQCASPISLGPDSMRR